MAYSLTGGCACGAVRYTGKGDAKFAFHCQCRDCQHMTGSGHSTQFAIDRENFEVTGDLTWWNRDTDAGSIVSNGFCATCGAPVYGYTSRFPDNLMILAGSLDDPSMISPDRVFFADSAVVWDHISLPERNS